jgi:hypothetical protein
MYYIDFPWGDRNAPGILVAALAVCPATVLVALAAGLATYVIVFIVRTRG